MPYLQESGVSIYRRRRRHRAVITLTFVTMLLFATLVYAGSFVQGWVGSDPLPPVVNRTCEDIPDKPRDVTVNVYNTTPRAGLATTVARAWRRQGFKVAAIDNDPLGKFILGVGEIRHGPGRAAAAAAGIAAARLPEATIVADNRTDATVDIVLGTKFVALRATPAKDARPIAVSPTAPC